jgi:hypothetical protein
MTMTNDEQAALRQLLERLRREQNERTPNFGTRWRMTDLAREADALVPVIERLLNNKPGDNNETPHPET